MHNAGIVLCWKDHKSVTELGTTTTTTLADDDDDGEMAFWNPHDQLFFLSFRVFESSRECISLPIKGNVVYDWIAELKE